MESTPQNPALVTAKATLKAKTIVYWMAAPEVSVVGVRGAQLK